MKNALIILSILLLLFPASISAQGDEYDVPYVPSPPEVVAEMLRLADVKKDDIVYDLGCGDGRIVITAAEKIGARGVGIDINPERIKESIENAEKANVTERVKFIQQDLFEATINEATVVTLYLLQDVNLRLRPRLIRELKPGTRVVSHDFSMAEWKPDSTSEIHTSYAEHTVYYWIVPANMSGIWKWTVPAEMSNKEYVLHLEQKFQQVTGMITSGTTEIPVTDMVLTGDRIHFTMDEHVNRRLLSTVYEGRVSGNTIDGYMTSKTGSSVNKSCWHATRDPSTIGNIDSPESDEK